MQILSVSNARNRLNELIDAVATTREQVTITKNGSPAAVMVGAEEWESLQETLFWLSQPGTLADVQLARSELDKAPGASESEVRAEFGVPGRRVG